MTGVSTESGPGIDTRTATVRGCSQAMSPAIHRRRPAPGVVLSGTRAKAIPLLTALQLAARPCSRRNHPEWTPSFRPARRVRDRSRRGGGRGREGAHDRRSSSGCGPPPAPRSPWSRCPPSGRRTRRRSRSPSDGRGAWAPTAPSARPGGTPASCCSWCRCRTTSPAPGTSGSRWGRGSRASITDAGAGRIRELIRPDLVPARSTAWRSPPRCETLASTIARGMGVDDTTLTNARPARAGSGPGAAVRGPAPVPAVLPLLSHRDARLRTSARRRRHVYWGGPWIGGGFGGGLRWRGLGRRRRGGFGGFGGGGGFSGGGAGGRF